MGFLTYELCDDDGEIGKLLAAVMAAHHEPLATAGVTVSAVLAAKETKDGPVVALKRNGLEIAAKIGIASLADRARGLADAKLTIDRLTWERMPVPQREALLDHELQHLAIVTSKDGNDRDDLGRPRLKLRPHDWELTGFAAVVERHGEAAVESVGLARFRADFGEQLNLFGNGKTKPKRAAAGA